MTREELEQEYEIVSAELQSTRTQLDAMRVELDQARGAARNVVNQATAAGVALAIPTTPQELERADLDARAQGIEEDLQALKELHNPPSQATGPVESALDVVRANNRERSELQDRLSAANNIVSRLAALARVDRWDAEGTEIRDAVQRYQTLAWEIGRRQTALKRDIAALAKHENDERAEMRGWVQAFDFVLAKLGEIAGPSSDQVDAARYRRLRVHGVMTGSEDTLQTGTKDDLQMRFNASLDAFVDANLLNTPSQGEATE